MTDKTGNIRVRMVQRLFRKPLPVIEVEYMQEDNNHFNSPARYFYAWRAATAGEVVSMSHLKVCSA